MKVLISGAGIGGLTTALCLQQAGHEVEIFEQASEFKEVGAGLQLGANALRVIDHLGLLGKLAPLAVEPEAAEFRHYQSGELLYQTSFGDHYQQKYGAPYYHLYRADLQAVLVRAFETGASKVGTTQGVAFNASVQSYTESANDVSISLQDGRRFSGDCLIAADGVRSVIRNQLLGASQPEFSGNVAWRGVLPTNKLPDGFMQTVVSNFVGPGKHMVIYYLRQRTLVNFVGVVENRQSKAEHEDSWVTNAPWQDLQADYAGWHPTVQAVINAVDKQQCYRWALHNHQPFDHWSSRRVTLLGDAAHSTLPFMAAGAAMAIEDGRILQRCLDRCDSVAEGLQLYQNNRLKRTARIQKASSRLGKLYHLGHSVQRKLAYASLRAAGESLQEFMPQYDANTVELR